MMATISTGSKAMDALLGGGIHTGMITDIYGESGSGKSQLCFTLCANCAKEAASALFIDTAGTFRPERIMEISGSQLALEKITLIRTFTTIDQTNATKKILEVQPTLVIVDSLASLLAINSRCAIVVTNMVRTAPPITVIDQAGRNIGQAIVPWQQREYLGSSVSIYSHMKMKLEIVDSARSSFQAVLVQPAGKGQVPFAITLQGISDSK
jgi:RecA/RadA recombinase